jgi:outer membrane protein TolC
MKHTYLIFLVSLLALEGWAEDSVSLLSEEKQTVLRLQKEVYEAENEKLRTNWIAPLNLSGSYSFDKSAQGDYRSTTENVSASINQDIFRSGGILYQIAYADAKKEREILSRLKEIANLNEQLFTALLSYRKTLYQKEQSLQKLKNYEIEIFIKRQLFEAGKADITELNNALMNKSTELKNLVSLEYTMAEQRYEIAKISNIDPASFELPRFELIDEESYVDGQFDLRYTRANTQTLRYSYDVTTTDYLPSVALNAALGYQNYDPINRIGDYEGRYYSTGVSITLPLTYNASASIQEAKATYLKEAAAAADKQREIRAGYAQSIEKIKSYRSAIAITSQNLFLYEDLIKAIRSGVDAGTKTGYDLQTLQNSKTIEEYDLKINEINIQIELAKLHFSLKPSKDL